MKKDNVMPDNFFDKETLKAFLTGCENQNRFNVSVISSICLELSEADNTENDSGFRNDCANRILKQCSQIMKMADIYRIISDTLSENSLITEYVEFSSYLEYFTEQCSELLGNSCKIILNHGEKKETDIIKKLLDFSLAMFIRKSVFYGAQSIEISYKTDADRIILELSADEVKKEIVNEYAPETFSVEFADIIISSAAQKMDCVYTSEDGKMILSIPVKKSSSGKFSIPVKKHSKMIFSTLNNIFSDLNDINII